MDNLLQDLRYAFRNLLRQPSFALAAIATLALGIGATTAIFSVVNSVMLRPLPFERPDRIVALTNLWTETGRRSSTVSAPDFHDWRAQNRSFKALANFSGGETSVTVNGTAEFAAVYRVTPEFFDVLGARAAVGRLPAADEQAPGGPLTVVITDAFWRQQFNADPTAIGSTIKAGDHVFSIVGVLAPGVRHPARADIYYPAWLVPETVSRSGHNYRALARLRDEVSLAQARDDMRAIASRLEQLYPESNAGKQVAVVPLKEMVVGQTRTTFNVLLGAVALVLLIACANVANLQLARSSVRSREMVVRAAVGASRARLVRQLLTESAVLGLVSGLAGAWLARLGVLALVTLAPADLPRADEIRADTIALVFAVVTAIVSSLIFGLAPALQASRTQLVNGLREGGKGTSIGRRGSRARQTFVVAQVALAVVLVAGAGLLARSLAALSAVDMGFEPEGLLVLRTSFPVQSFSEAPRATAFYRDVLAQLRGLPGVEAAGGVTSLPTVIRSNGGYAIEGVSDFSQGVRLPQAVFNVVTPEYFRTLRVPVLRGRDFVDGDRMGAPYVAIVNGALARAAFPDQDPIGRRIQCGLDTLEFMTIVGVVGDVRTAGPQSPAQPEIFMPYEQHPGPATALNLVVRSRLADPLALAETIRQKIAARNPDVPVKASTMAETLDIASATPRFRTFLLVVFGGVALLLALAGVYSVMAYTVNQRIPELGVRIALGASPQRILGLIMTQGATLSVVGLIVGVALAMASSRALEGLLFGVAARDPIILVAVTVLVALATLVACYIPGRRALRVDPMIALRAQ